MKRKPFFVVLLVVVTILAVAATWLISKSDNPANPATTTSSQHNTVSVTRGTTPILDGPYVGWTRYHNKELRFSINSPVEATIGDYAVASPSDPPYAAFLMDLYNDQSGRTIEFLHLAVYEAGLETSAHTQDTLRSDIYQVTPTKEDVTVAGHKAILYYYDGDIRAALYLIEDGSRTFAINGFIHTKNPDAVANYWNGFDNAVASFAIDDSASSN